MFQLFSRYLSGYPEPTHGEILRFKVLVVEMPEEDEDNRKKRFIAVHYRQQLPDPGRCEAWDDM